MSFKVISASDLPKSTDSIMEFLTTLVPLPTSNQNLKNIIRPGRNFCPGTKERLFLLPN